MFSYLQNFFNLTESAAKAALFAAWLVILVITAVVTRLSLKAIVSVIVVGMIVIGVANNSALIREGGNTTVKEIKDGNTTGLRAPAGIPAGIRAHFGAGSSGQARTVAVPSDRQA